MVGGQRFDKFASWKATRIGHWLGRYIPSLNLKLLNSVVGSAMQTSWGQIEDEFRFERKPEYVNNISTMLINDSLIPEMRAGRIVSVHGIRRVIGPRSIEMEDGTMIEGIDAIITCTGYHTPFTTLREGLNFTSPAEKIAPQPDLYQNIFALEYPDSLACLNFVVAPENAAGCRELAAMAIAQVWAGKSELPPHDVMQSHIKNHHRWFARRCATQPVPQLEGLIEGHSWLKFVHQTAGTGLYERLGWTWSGVWFSLKNPSLYFTMAFGVNTPHMWRLFETGKRKAWPDALKAILHVNHQSKEDLNQKVGDHKVD